MRAALSLMCSLLLVVSLTAPVAAQQKEPIEIGAFLTLTGKIALAGALERNGVMQALDDINAGGGINGRPLKVTIEDSADSNTTAVNAVRRLVEKPYPALIATLVGTQLLAVFPVIKEAQVPIVTMSGTRKITQVGNPWVFRFSAHDGISKPGLVKYAAEKLNIKKAAVIHESDEYGQSGRDLYLEAMKSHGIESVAVVSVDTGEKDLSAHLLRVKSAGAQAIFSQVHDSVMALLVKQTKRLGVTIPHFGSSAAGNVTVQKLASAEELEGLYFEYFVDLAGDTRPVVQDWVKRYRAKFNVNPDAYVALSYDRTMMLAKVMEKYGLERTAIQRGLREMTYTGIATEYRADREQSMNHQILVMRYGPDKQAKSVAKIQVPFEPYK